MFISWASKVNTLKISSSSLRFVKVQHWLTGSGPLSLNCSFVMQNQYSERKGHVVKHYLFNLVNLIRTPQSYRNITAACTKRTSKRWPTSKEVHYTPNLATDKENTANEQGSSLCSKRRTMHNAITRTAEQMANKKVSIVQSYGSYKPNCNENSFFGRVWNRIRGEIANICSCKSGKSLSQQQGLTERGQPIMTSHSCPFCRERYRKRGSLFPALKERRMFQIIIVYIRSASWDRDARQRHENQVSKIIPCLVPSVLFKSARPLFQLQLMKCTMQKQTGLVNTGDANGLKNGD